MNYATLNKVLGDLRASHTKWLVKKINNSNLLLIQGDKESILGLANILITMVNESIDDISFSPDGAGSAFLKKNSTMGFYIDILPEG